MEKMDNGIFRFYRFENLGRESRILHFVSSSDGNIGLGEDGAEIALDNRRRLAASVGFDLSRMVLARQVHGADIAVVKERDVGRGAQDDGSRLDGADALVTNVPEICLTVLTADCVPLLLYDPVREVIAAVHAGWRGTVAGIAEKTVERMVKMFGSRPEDMLAGIGPSIGPCCFEVGSEVAENLEKRCPGTCRPVEGGESGKYFADLWRANRQQLVETGLVPARVETAGLCTACPSADFFSYRRSGGGSDRFGSGIVLKRKDRTKG